MQITTQQARRLAHVALRQGILEGAMIGDLDKRAKKLVEIVSNETPIDPDTPQWWVVTHAPYRMLTAKSFGQDQQAAMDFAELQSWSLWAVVHAVDWQNVERHRIDKKPKDER